jgi:hypothetical protein
MRHLREFEEDETLGDLEDLSSMGFDTYEGYLIALNTTNSGDAINWGSNFVIIVARNDKEAIDTFLSDFEDWDDDLDAMKTWDDVVYSFEEWFGSDTVFHITSRWKGLKLKSLAKGPSIEAISADNPLLALQALEAKFSNVRELLTKYPVGTGVYE